MYIDIYFTDELPCDRDDIEDALDELDGFEVVGAGKGVLGSNLDVEVAESIPRARAVSMVTGVLRRFDAHHAAYLRLSDTGERVNAVDVEGVGADPTPG
ncbi:hypothetical protein [Polymorphospora sp. NPDC050346]|uniref:hypothetical protein n=1 Tax=Polymorphospora sp. NPDC050346 TaxID=3155780 RepID=UPI0033F248B6